MLKHYFKSAIKGLLKKKLFTAINIFGLAAGLAMCLAVLGHLSYELSFENFHENADHIYRVELTYTHEDEMTNSARVMAPLGRAIASELPEVEHAAVFRVYEINRFETPDDRYRIDDGYEGAGYVHGDKLVFADPEYLKIFTFPMVVGNAEQALREPYSALITQEAAERYFPGINPMGQQVIINREFECRITGILENIPQNSQLYCDFIVSYATLERAGRETEDWNVIDEDYVYVTLNESADSLTVVSKIKGIIDKNLPPDQSKEYSFRLQPLHTIYFNAYTAGNRGELSPGGEASMIYEIGIIALFVLILAVTNFINLSTARSADRMKEVGVRKVLGAGRMNLIRQFIGESLLITIVSTAVAVGIYELFKFWVTPKLPREMFADFYNNPTLVFFILGLIVTVGIIAGFYPALYLSRFKPVAILQGKRGFKSSKSVLRKVLVVLQFTIAIMFICSTVILMEQFNFITSIDLGFERENMLVLEFEGDNAADNCSLMKREIESRHNVLSTTIVNSPPGAKGYTFYAMYTNEERKWEDQIVGKLFASDYDFLSTFNITLTRGRWFSPAIQSDETQALVVNEATVKHLGLSDPIGHKIYGGGDKFYEIIGVVEDFQGATLDYFYKDMMFMSINPKYHKRLVVHVPPGDIQGSVAAIKSTWEQVLPEEFFVYSFLDDDIAAAYSDIAGQKQIFLIISMIAIGIACLGIFGLVSYTAERRTKEIGIRKVMGASIAGIVSLLSKEFVMLIIIANVIGWPCAYLMMHSFLSEFPFRVSIGIWTFMMTGIIALGLALLTCSFQSVKAALANPVSSLRHE